MLGQKATPKRRVANRKKSAVAAKPLTVALYAGVFIAIIAMIAAGNQTPDAPIAAVASAESMRKNTAPEEPTSVNEIVSATVAANVAETANLPIATNVANLSTSLSIKNDVASDSNAASGSVAKQQISQSASSRRDLISYTTRPGDTAESVAREYGISKDTLKWSNNLTSDALDANKTLTIPPVDGIVYTTKKDDTVKKLAEKYKASEERIIAFNDLELQGLHEGAKIIIPAGELPETERPGYVAPRPKYTAPVYGGSVSSGTGNFMQGSFGNRYVYGYCTWYAYEKRAKMGRPVGSLWGDAKTWAAAARAGGYVVSNEPTVGAVFQTPFGGGGYGHVGIIESIDTAAGTLTYSDMNGIAGWNRIGSRTITIAQAKSQWQFIQ